MTTFVSGRALKIAAGVAIAFGLLTLVSGGVALFGGADMGAVVAYVLWFNFLSGAVYILAGIGIFFGKDWGAWLAYLLAIALGLVFVAFGWHVVSGQAYEVRTMGAMILRAGFWIGLAVAVHRARTDPARSA